MIFCYNGKIFKVGEIALLPKNNRFGLCSSLLLLALRRLFTQPFDLTNKHSVPSPLVFRSPRPLPVVVEQVAFSLSGEVLCAVMQNFQNGRNSASIIRAGTSNMLRSVYNRPIMHKTSMNLRLARICKNEL